MASKTVRAATSSDLIHEVRGRRIIFDFDLAGLYAVETRVLVQSVKRNATRFSTDFMFQLTAEEFADWRSQIVISNPRMKMGLRRRPCAFTEHGAVMLANVLRSQAAIDMSVHVVRAFIRTREVMVTRAMLAGELRRLKRSLDRKFRLYDESFQHVFRAIEQMIVARSQSQQRKIGFHRD